VAASGTAGEGVRASRGALAPPLGRDADVLHRDDHGRGGGGLAGEIIPTFLIKLERPDDRQREAVHAARARGARPLHPRRVLQLPLADGASVALRDGALRRVLEAGRVRVRPSVPLGLASHRAGSGPHRRQVSRPLARAPLRTEPNGDRAELDHAGVPAPAHARAGLRRHPARVDAMAMLGVPYGDAVKNGRRRRWRASRPRRSRRRAGRRWPGWPRRQGDHGGRRLPAAPRHRPAQGRRVGEHGAGGN
jgi:hypothetical protein